MRSLGWTLNRVRSRGRRGRDMAQNMKQMVKEVMKENVALANENKELKRKLRVQEETIPTMDGREYRIYKGGSSFFSMPQM